MQVREGALKYQESVPVASEFRDRHLYDSSLPAWGLSPLDLTEEGMGMVQHAKGPGFHPPH